MNRIDFAGIISALNCNPNGDPIQGNMPREDMEGFGFITDVCIKRKIRDRLNDFGENILMLSDISDGIFSIKDRIKKDADLMELKKQKDLTAFVDAACKKWIDVRSFGQVFAFNDKSGNISKGIRGPVSIGLAYSLEPINITPIQITKTINTDTNEKEPLKKDSSTMGMKYVIEKGIYVFYGSISPQLAEKTGFTGEDADKIKNAMTHLFDNDSSSSRPAGSMSVEKLYWWTHKNKIGQYSVARVHRSLSVRAIEEKPYFKAELEPLPGLECEVIAGW